MKKLIFILILLMNTIAFGAAADMMVTQAGGGDKSGSTWANAMAETDFVADLEASAEAGDRYFIKGNLTLSESYDTALSGEHTAPIWIIGVESDTTAEPPTSADWAYETDRPTITTGDNTFVLEDHYRVMNLIVTSTTGSCIVADTYTHIINCLCDGDGVNCIGLSGAYNAIISCELKDGTDGASIDGSSAVINCYIHDTTSDGVYQASHANFISSCVIDTCPIGINFGTKSGTLAMNNTIYNSTTCGLYGTTGLSCYIVNNIIDSCAVGIEWTTPTESNYIDFNCWNNTDDVKDTDVTLGTHAVMDNPDMVAPATGDFSLQAVSPCLDAGMQLGVNIGVTDKDYKVNIGADQDDNTSGGSGRGLGRGIGN